jgi:hypothetical protein
MKENCDMHLKNSLKLHLVATLTLVALVTGALFASPVRAMDQLSQQAESQFIDLSQVVFVQGSVVLDDIGPGATFNFITDLENDPLWYPGTLSSELISGNGGPGSTYQEVVAFGPEPITITATVLAVRPNHRFLFTSDSFLANVTQYEVQRRPHHKTKVTISSFVQLPPGFTKEALEEYLTLVLNTLPGALGTTGTVKVK